MRMAGKSWSLSRGHLWILAPLLLFAVLLLSGGIFFRYGMIFFVDDPLRRLEKLPPLKAFRDCNGELLYLERNREGQWRFAIPLSQVPPHLIKAVLATEDFNFFHHGGVDWKAVARAVWQNIFYRRRISGASTLTMQLAGMSLPGRHTLFWKCRQMWGAWKLEKLYSKETILMEYLNRLPFGGRIYGVESGALYYFGVPAKELTPPQSALLSGLPQRPNFFRPDRHRERAIKRMQLVLGMMYERNLITREEKNLWQKERKLNFRDFQVPASFLLYGNAGNFLHPLNYFRKTAENREESTLSIHKELTEKVLSILRNRVEKVPGVSSAAVLLVENATGKVRIYIGSSDLANLNGGQIDMIQKRREAGSTLKPFIYGEAIEGGLLTGATLLHDAPLRYGDYAPGNFDNILHGRIPAETALVRSLNTPVIRLTAFLGVKRVESMLVKAGFHSFTPEKGREPGVTIALGCGGCTLWELVRSFRTLANGGRLLPLTLAEKRPLRDPPGKQVFSPGTCALLSSMLRKKTPGRGVPDYAWKTGTSSNFRDAWTILYTPSHTLGVWFGNPSGKSSPGLVGAKIALPAAEEILSLVRDMDSSFSDSWQKMDSFLEERPLCRASGLTPTAFCKEKLSSPAVPGIPLPLCRACGRKKQNIAELKILSPLPGEYFLTKGQKKLELPFKIAAPPGKKTILFINGEPLPAGKDFLSFEKEGIYNLKVCLILPGEEGKEMNTVTSGIVTIKVRRWLEE